MKILLSPSESKNISENSARSSGSQQDALGCGVESKLESILDSSSEIINDEMWGGKIARNTHIQAYLHTLRSASDSELCKLFGTKVLKLDMLRQCVELLNAPRMRAIELYSGVAYKALSFASLDSRAQKFVLESVLITSNLFGLVRASDLLPFYHLNQNYKSATLSLSALYKAQKREIDELLQKGRVGQGEMSGENGCENCGGSANSVDSVNDVNSVGDVIIDLRAQVYSKAYPLQIPHYVLEIPGKTSHQAKLYRGVALRELAETYAKCNGDEKVMASYVKKAFALRLR